jgi:hypothetical protein
MLNYVIWLDAIWLGFIQKAKKPELYNVFLYASCFEFNGFW